MGLSTSHLTTAAITYSSTYSDGYPPDLPTLGGVGLATCNGAILLDDTFDDASLPQERLPA